MSNIVIRRTGDESYQLEIAGSVVENYDRQVMAHPWDWAEDAKSNGATEADIRARNYDYIDDR